MFRPRALPFLTGCVMLFAGTASAGPINVATTTDPTALVNALLGAGVQLVGTPTLIGGTTQQGLFNDATGILPFDAGVMLTTGDVYAARGPNVYEGFTAQTGTGGNSTLSSLAGYATFDQNVLAFDFIPTTDTVTLQFVFASEEYHELVGSRFNDVFAFLLNGTNIALVPGTATPISVNNVNCASNSAYYGANSVSSPCFNQAQRVYTEYDGLVGGLYAMPLFATGSVTPGVVNRMVFSIADGSDTLLDSAVFLRAGSFTNAPIANPEPATLLLLGSGLIGAGLLRRRQKPRS